MGVGDLQGEDPMGNLFDYTGKRVVLTGGATGIGAALAELLDDLGVEHLTILDIKEPTGRCDRFICTDLSDPASLDAALGQLTDRIDVVFSNAGVAANAGVRTCMAVNVAASRRLADGLIDRIPAGGTIVFTASMAGNGWPAKLGEINALLDLADWDEFLDWCEAHPEVVEDVYGFSKMCMQVYVMRACYASIRRGVRINSICPAPVDTPLMADFRETMGDKVIDWSVTVQGNGRMAVAADIAPPLVFMGSDAASFINGVNLLVDAGFTAAMTTGQADFSGLA
jgi:NAD(P)-dependent dehydrogenase (short-subunit alcohol dehydrogenase family)